MTSSNQNHIVSKPLRIAVCAALAIALTGITTQVIVSSAGQHEYGVAPKSLVVAHAAPDFARRMTVAQVR
jgi:hypothetical protein